MKKDPEEEVCPKCFHPAEFHLGAGCKVCRCLMGSSLNPDPEYMTRQELIDLLEDHREDGTDVDEKINALKQGKGMQP